ncbi:acyl-CoA dehydrogenase family protein [Parahaliea mediterranea]|uniref:Acyl-CoA/acyl-ACP dehydrogenase n=1 Tax=Parahaliea mediterranea TaxID=651086 RepID=A0A939DH53_9GAMM|nr:acyl-CoA dehydrogenase family protein [Parahaliea mediterranea]MBN7797953.1 acyl-CoA/acyl-ACP dehydrogenase [Parahaliea mediterranea]
MAQPNDFGFGEEAAMLKDAARKFFADNLPVAALHQLVADNHDPDRGPAVAWREDLWRQMVELGWTALAIPEAAGGLGMPLVAVAGLVEELGRAAFPCPLLGTLNATFVLAACGDRAAAALDDIGAGRAATLALTNRDGDWNPAATELRASGGTLSGTAWFVQDAGKVDRLLAAAHTEGGLGLFWVDAGAAGVRVHGDAIVDLTRDQAHVSFDNVEAVEVSANALAALNTAFPAIWTLLAADIAGAAEWQLQTTVEYANTRKQFDRPLGFFQAVKHPLVDVMIGIDEVRSLLYNAACACDTEPEKAGQYAHMALAAASDLAGFASSRSVQYHGGIGFTWECFVHLYFKRQKHSQALWGDGAWHRARLAEILLDTAA